RSLPLPLDQAIPEAPRRLDRHLGDGSLLQLLAEPANVHVDETRVAPGLVAPDPDQKIVARENASGLASQRPQELELRGRQRKLLVARDRLQAREIDDEPTKPELPVLAVMAVDASPERRRACGRSNFLVKHV